MSEGPRLTPDDLELNETQTEYISLDLREAREALERKLIQRALARNGNQITQAALDLGITRPTLYDLMQKLGIRHKSE